jgi:uncharacterized protein (DUF427 family)
MHRRSGILADEQEFGPFAADKVAAEPTPKRVRARRADEWVLDTDRALIAWVEGPTPDYAIPFADVDVELATGQPREHERLGTVEDVAITQDGARREGAGVRVQRPPKHAQRLRDHVVFDWDALDAWFVEDERQRGHPRDPYHRIDVHASSRRIEVALGDETVADTDRALGVVETRLPFRFYVPEVDGRGPVGTQPDADPMRRQGQGPVLPRRRRRQTGRGRRLDLPRARARVRPAPGPDLLPLGDGRHAGRRHRALVTTRRYPEKA